MDNYPELKEATVFTKEIADAVSPFDELIFLDKAKDVLVRKRKNSITWEARVNGDKWLPIKFTKTGWDIEE